MVIQPWLLLVYHRCITSPNVPPWYIMRRRWNVNSGNGKLVDSFDEACNNLGISRAKAYREVQAGTLRTYLDGRLRKVTRKAQADYVALKQRQSGAREAA
jgi:excisionase family DNA binding protein